MLTNIKLGDSITVTTCVLIKKSCLTNIKIELVNKAIKDLKTLALSQIKSYRTQSGNEPKSREYVFWSQQFINTTIYIEDLATIKNIQQKPKLVLDEKTNNKAEELTIKNSPKTIHLCAKSLMHSKTNNNSFYGAVSFI